MGKSKSRQSLGILNRGAGILPALLSLVIAGGAAMSSPLLRASQALEFPKTGDFGSTDVTSGGGTRGEDGNEVFCTASGEKRLRALMPTVNPNKVETTLAANPTIFVYVPETEEPVQAEFFVVDDRGKIVYVTDLELTGRGGIYKLSIPATKALQVGQDYLWQFAIICDPGDVSSDAYVEGWIRRTEISSEEVKQNLEGAEPLKQAEIYASEKIWHDTVKLAADMRSNHPVEWRSLLRSVDLETLAEEPLHECVPANSENDIVLCGEP